MLIIHVVDNRSCWQWRGCGECDRLRPHHRGEVWCLHVYCWCWLITDRVDSEEDVENVTALGLGELADLTVFNEADTSSYDVSIFWIYPLYFSTVIYRIVWFTAWPLVLRTCKTWKCYRILQLSENVHPRWLRISCLKNFSSYFFYILAVSVNTLVTSMKQKWLNRSVCCFGYELGGLREPLSGGAVILPQQNE